MPERGQRRAPVGVLRSLRRRDALRRFPSLPGDLHTLRAMTAFATTDQSQQQRDDYEANLRAQKRLTKSSTTFRRLAVSHRQVAHSRLRGPQALNRLPDSPDILSEPRLGFLTGLNSDER